MLLVGYLLLSAVLNKTIKLREEMLYVTRSGLIYEHYS